MKNSLTIPVAIALGGVIVAVAVYASMPKTSPTDTGNAALVRAVGATDHILGNPAAPVMIVEYSDFDCTYCKDIHETLHQIIANEGASGKVAWVFREFPLTEIHPNAFSHARAAECIAKTTGNDAFWKYTNRIFEITRLEIYSSDKHGSYSCKTKMGLYQTCDTPHVNRILIY